MHTYSARRAVGLVLASCALLAAPAPAFAAGGGGGGGGGGPVAGGSATDPATAPKGGAPCVQVNSVSVSSDQSVVTDGVSLSGSYTVSRCGGNNASFTVSMTADDAAGNRVISASDTWITQRSLPFSGSHSTETAAFGASYQITVTVIVPETGAVAASASRSIATPASRVAVCATITNLDGTAGYYPGNTTAGALWLSYSVKNCGGREQLDTTFAVVNQGSGTDVYRSSSSSGVVAGNTSYGIGLMDVEPVPTGTPYTVVVEVRDHLDGRLLDNRSIDLATPVAK